MGKDVVGNNAEFWEKSSDKGTYWETIKYDLFLQETNQLGFQ